MITYMTQIINDDADDVADLPHDEGGRAPAGLNGGWLPADRAPPTQLLRGQE